MSLPQKKNRTEKQMEKKKKIYVTAYLNLLSLVHFKIIYILSLGPLSNPSWTTTTTKNPNK